MSRKLYHQIHKIWLLSVLHRLGTFKDAANEARISQSALSQSLTALEEVFGKTLVIRGRGAASLTEDGLKLVEKAQPILSSIDALDLPDLEEKEFKGKLRLGAYESIAIDLLPGLLLEMRKKHSGLRVDLKTSRSSALVKSVRKGELEMAIVVEASPEQRIDVETLMEDELGLYVSARHGIATEAYSDIQSALKKYGLGTISSGVEGLPPYYKRFLNQLNGSYQVVMSSDSFESIRSLTTTGSIIGLLPGSVANRGGGDLLKVWPDTEGVKISRGRHRICLVSRSNVDPQLKKIVFDQLKTVLDEGRSASA